MTNRSIISALAVALCCSGEAMAAPDGKAIAQGPAAQLLRQRAPGPLDQSAMRRLIATLLNSGLSSTELDLVEEIAAEGSLVVTADGQPMELARTAEARAFARTLMAPPNFNTLWHAGPAESELLVELSRWGENPRTRVITFIGTKLNDAWVQSNVANQLDPFVNALGHQYNRFKALPDASSREEGFRLLKAGCEVAKQKALADGRTPPAEILCSFL